MAQKRGLQYITVPAFVAYLSSARKYRLIIIARVRACINYIANRILRLMVFVFKTVFENLEWIVVLLLCF